MGKFILLVDGTKISEDRGVNLVAGSNITLTPTDTQTTVPRIEITGGAGSGDVASDAIWDAAGDLVVGTGANTAARLAKGNDTEVLTMVAGAVAWAAGGGGVTSMTFAGNVV